MASGVRVREPDPADALPVATDLFKMLQLLSANIRLAPSVHRAANLRGLRDPTPLPQTPSSVPRLPNEVIRKIIREIGSSHYSLEDGLWRETDDQPWRDLAACAQTSHAFLGVARERLYRRVTITLEPLEDSDWWTESNDGGDIDFSAVPEELVYASRPADLQRTLVYAPHLAALVRQVEIRIEPQLNFGPELVSLPGRVLATVMGACRLVDELTITARCEEFKENYLAFEASCIAIEILSDQSPHLQRLKLSGLDFADEDGVYDDEENPAFALLRKQTGLKSLMLGPNTYWRDIQS